MMVRKLAAAMLSAGVFIPGLAHALGLGEIKLNSALSEPLDANIELVQVRELTPSEILPSLAGGKDFESANVERFHFLTDLRFEVLNDAQGKPYIHVKSTKPVREPFLNFLVEVNWPAGRLLREYTLFLDPPVYSSRKQAPVAPAQASQRTSAATQATGSAGAPSTGTVYKAPAASGSGSRSQAAAGTAQHVVGRNDSLWVIAQKMKPSDRVNIQQTMLALQDKNPEAFIDNNINLLRQGATLTAPTEAEALAFSTGRAQQMTAEQNAQWEARNRGEQIAETTVTAPVETKPAPTSDAATTAADTAATAAPAAAEPESDGRLKLVSADPDASLDNGQGGAGDGDGSLRDKLALSEETTDQFRLENEELSLRVDDLEEQLDTSEKVLSLKDEQIAALQARLAELEREQEQGAADALELGAAQAGSAAETAAEQPAEAERDYNFENDAPAGETAGVTPASGTDSANMDASEPTVTDEAASTGPDPETRDWLEKVLSNPMYLGIGAGALILALIGGLLATRRRPQESSFIADEQINELDLPGAAPRFEAEPIEEFNSINIESDHDFEDAVEASVATSEASPAIADVLNEADIYIAYGRFPQALELLEEAAQREPGRADIQLKLCEVCAEAGERERFEQHIGQLAVLGDAAAVTKAEALRSKFGDDPAALSDEFASLETGDSVPGADSAESVDADMSLDFPATDEPVAGSQGVSDPLEFEVDNGQDDRVDESAEHTALDDADQAGLGGDDNANNGLDFELDLGDSAAPAATTAEDFLGGDATEESAAEFDSDLSHTLDFSPETASELDPGGEAESELPPQSELSESNDNSAADLTDLAELDAGAGAAGAAGFMEASIDPDTLDDEVKTKMDLAQAYIDMGDREGARDILDEVISEGSSDQQSEARRLLVMLES